MNYIDARIECKTEAKIPCECYSRVAGYFRPVAQWNNAKREEFSDRQYINISEFTK